MYYFQPDYRNVVDAACNRASKRLPLYEHIISTQVLEEILGQPFSYLASGDEADKAEYFRRYVGFLKDHGYDIVPFECCVCGILPGGGALGAHKEGVIKTREDFEKYPWNELESAFFQLYTPYFAALGKMMPAGMKAVGGVGNGVFECVQDLTGYIDLCYIRSDDPELYHDLFSTMGNVIASIWKRFLTEWGDVYCVMRFGDDLGFATSTLLPPGDIQEYIIPQYKKVIEAVHQANKPFLLHSCGNIFNVMNDLIAAGIDAKHSNEDKIATFPVWVENYGDRIGNFGGIDMNCLCELDKQQMREYIADIIKRCGGHGGFAFGTGNSIADYIPAESYLNMIEIVREIRGDFK
ncbi:MAG: uroporphyrinogen decarboxylase family protein [Christensenellales bacterium]|jgi:uroporphyrinogen decarboxylase